MKEIPLNHGCYTLVDDEDYEILKNYNWHTKLGRHTYYAIHDIRIGKKKTTVHMHRIIINAPKGSEVDHLDGNGLNNQKSNLRITTRRENALNHHSQKSSKYPGVSWKTSDNQWRAGIYINGRNIHLGLFKNEEDAAWAYQVAKEAI